MSKHNIIEGNATSDANQKYSLRIGTDTTHAYEVKEGFDEIQIISFTSPDDGVNGSVTFKIINPSQRTQYLASQGRLYARMSFQKLHWNVGSKRSQKTGFIKPRMTKGRYYSGYQLHENSRIDDYTRLQITDLTQSYTLVISYWPTGVYYLYKEWCWYVKKNQLEPQDYPSSTIKTKVALCNGDFHITNDRVYKTGSPLTCTYNFTTLEDI